MVTKVLLAVTGLAFTAFATNDSNFKKIAKISIDPLTAKDAAESFEEALQEEEPLLKEEEEKAGSSQQKALINTRLRSPKKVQAAQAPLSLENLSPFTSGAWASDFESDVANLVMGLSAGGLGATPMGETVSKISDLIEKDMMPKVVSAHDFDQELVNNMSTRLVTCNTTLSSEWATVNTKWETYAGDPNGQNFLHKTCRKLEDELYKELETCRENWRGKKTNKTNACETWLEAKAQYGEENNNNQIMTKVVGEDIEGFVSRVTSVICGAPLDCVACSNGVMENGVCRPADNWHGFYDDLKNKRIACEGNVTAFVDKTAECKTATRVWENKKSDCDVVQHNMDAAACDWALEEKTVCGAYVNCYTGGLTTENNGVQLVQNQEADRKAEWKGLKKMKCLIDAFATPAEDPRVTQDEIDTCRLMEPDISHLAIVYPDGVNQEVCVHSQRYPSNAEYVAEEFTPLPGDAKGKLDSYQCVGLTEVSTIPAAGSPASCTCEVVELGDSTFSPGALVKCSNCNDVYRSNDKNSCPIGTKLFSPRSQEDWTTFLAQTLTQGPLRAPNFIFDVTRAHTDTRNDAILPRNSGTADNADMDLRLRWMTSDGSPWWLQTNDRDDDTVYTSYQPNCFMDLLYDTISDTQVEPWKNYQTASLDSTNDDPPFHVSFSPSGNCSYHSHSYYCQPVSYDLSPTVDPAVTANACTCKKVELVGPYSAHLLLKCEECIPIRSSQQTNSCPASTKLFAPQSREDWKTFLASAAPLRAPHWIIDVTRPQAGCGETGDSGAARVISGVAASGCNVHPMKSTQPEMATWRTQDWSPWWLRDEGSSSWEGGEEYKANCYMNLFAFHNEDNIAFETKNSTRTTAVPAPSPSHAECEFYSTSYYCQSELTTTTTTPPPAKCSTAYTEESQCPTDHILASNLDTRDCTADPCDTNSAEDDALCCEAKATCDTFTCDPNSATTQNKGSGVICPSTADSCDAATCCEAPCYCDDCSAPDGFYGTSAAYCDWAYDMDMTTCDGESSSAICSVSECKTICDADSSCGGFAHRPVSGSRGESCPFFTGCKIMATSTNSAILPNYGSYYAYQKCSMPQPSPR